MTPEPRDTVTREQAPAETPEPAPEVDELASLQAERDQFLADLQRVAADFDNYRKRAVRDQAAFAERATERLVTELLPVLDALEGALDAAGQHEEAKLEEGVRLVHRQLADALGKQGVAEIDTEGKFDPHVHEAVLSQPSETEEGSIVNVLQKGYRLGEKVVRPARVAVSAGVPEIPEV
jgi:molecular chaperone GrpE